MTELLTPEQVAEMRVMDDLYSDPEATFAPCVQHRRLLLRDREAICERLERAEAKLAKVREGLEAVSDLIAASDGVYGLHHNGDGAPWDELRAGGRFEGWLADFDAAIAILEDQS